MVDKLQEIKEIHNEFMYPTTNEFGIHEEDVEWLIQTIEQQQEDIRKSNQWIEISTEVIKNTTSKLESAQLEISRFRTIEQAYNALKSAL